MKKLILSTGIIFGIIIMNACNDGNNGSESNTDTSAVNNDTVRANAPIDTSVAATLPVNKDDSTFMAKAADGGMLEVELGQVAQQNAANDRVKNFGTMMINDHSTANNELNQLAARKNVTIPTALSDKHLKHKNDMGKKKGAAFDKAYINMMVEDHTEDIKEFEKAANSAQDADIKAYASKTLPVLRVHLDSAKAIKNAIIK